MIHFSFLAFVRKLQNRPTDRKVGLKRRRRNVPSYQAVVEYLEPRALLSGAAVVAQPDQPPVVTGFGGTLTYVPGGNQLSIASNVVVSDVDSNHLTGATVSFTNWQSGDRVGFFNTASLQWSFTEDLTAHTAALKLSGTTSLAAYQAELRTFAFFNVASNPSTATRVAQIQVTDGAATSSSVSENIRVGQAPVLTGFGGTVTYVKGASPLSFAPNIVVTDSESSTLQSAAVSFTNWQAGDRLNFYNSAALSHVFTENLTNHTAKLTLTGAGTLAAYQTELRSLTFANVAAAPVTTSRTVTIQVNDGTAASNVVSESIVFGQAPVLSGFSGTLTYTAGGATLKFATSIVVADASSSTLSGATVSFVNWQRGDRVSFFDAGLPYTFTENLTAHTANLIFAGTATLATYQSELRSLGFFNVGGSPVTTTRIATIQVNSSGAVSSSVSENIAVKLGVPTVSIASASTTEGNSGSKLLAFTVTLSHVSTTAVTVKYATSNQTAIAGSDYTATSGTLTIPAGQTSATINVPILGDTTVESNETFALTLSTPTNATLATATAIGTITNDDTAPSGTVLSDDTSDASGGSRVVDSTHYLAASFEEGPGFHILQSVTLLLNQVTAGSVTLALYTGSQAPESFAAALTSPASISTSLSKATFTTNGMVLLPNTKYWLVLMPTSGSFRWSFTNSSAGTGSGFTGQWASSANAGSTWTSSSTSPLQLSILAN